MAAVTNKITAAINFNLFNTPAGYRHNSYEFTLHCKVAAVNCRRVLVTAALDERDIALVLACAAPTNTI